jgi:hypothetical protein
VKYWPEWLPGGGFHTIAKMWSKQVHDTVDTGLDYVRKDMVSMQYSVSSKFILNRSGRRNGRNILLVQSSGEEPRGLFDQVGRRFDTGWGQ